MIHDRKPIALNITNREAPAKWPLLTDFCCKLMNKVLSVPDYPITPAYINSEMQADSTGWKEFLHGYTWSGIHDSPALICFVATKPTLSRPSTTTGGTDVAFAMLPGAWLRYHPYWLRRRVASKHHHLPSLSCASKWSSLLHSVRTPPPWLAWVYVDTVTCSSGLGIHK